MNPATNPFAPGAGCPPPELAGRDEQLAAAALAFARVRKGRRAKSILLIGLRGVGKTVLLNGMGEDAESTGIQTLHIEAHEARSLPALLAPELRVALLRLSRVERAMDLATRALHGLADFADAPGMRHLDSDVGLDPEPEAGAADDGDLGYDLAALLGAAGEAARAADTVLALFVDELQDVAEDELAAPTVALSSSRHCARRYGRTARSDRRGAGGRSRCPRRPGHQDARWLRHQRIVDPASISPRLRLARSARIGGTTGNPRDGHPSGGPVPGTPAR